MRMKITQVEITFENIDWIKIPIEAFWDMTLADIQIKHYGLAAGTVFLRLKAQADRRVQEFQGDVFTGDYDLRLFERLQRCDISQICLHCADGTAPEFEIPWPDEDDYKNSLQTVWIDETDSLCIKIGKGEV